MGLAMACPYGQDNPSFCTLCEIRKQPLRSRYDWAMALPPDDVTRILKEHVRCLRDLEGSAR